MVKNGMVLRDAALDDLMKGSAELKRAAPDYGMASQYYEGNRPEWFASVRYRLALARTGTTYKMNFAKTPVDALVDRLEINGITATDRATTAVLQKVLDDNQFDLEAGEVHLRCCEFGDAYVIVWPNDDIGNDEADDDEVARANDTEEGSEDSKSDIDIYYNDPRTVRVFYDEENPREKKYGIKRWQSGSRIRINLFYKDHIEKWVTRNAEARGNNAEDWEHFDDGTGTWPTENPTGRIPIFHFRTSRPYGTAQHIGAYGPQDAITKIVITHMTTMDYHGFPQRYALLGGALDEGDDDLEDFGFDDSDDDDSPSSSAGSANRATVHAEPGHLWMLRNVKSIGQFEASKSDVFLQPFETYVRAMAQLTTTPLHYFDPAGGVPSGESLRVADAPMVKKVSRLQASFGATWKDICEFILELLGHPNAVGTVNVHWENPAARDDLLTWDLALYKRQLGVPVRQVLLETGYSVEQLDEWEVPPAKWTPPPLPQTPGSGLPNLRGANNSTL
jgi:hypothetical protein